MVPSRVCRWFRNKYLLVGIIVLIIIIVIVVARRGQAKPNFETAPVARGSVVETVSVTGTVSPVSKANLAFEKSGSVAQIYVAVGDQVKRGQALISLDSASDQANLAAAQATYADTARGLRPEEVKAESDKVTAAAVALASAEDDAVNATHDGYTKALGAMVNYTDAFFNYPQSVNPTINLVTQSSTQATNINQERLGVTYALNQWSADLMATGTSSAAAVMTKSQDYLGKIKTFMTNLALIVNALSPGNSSLSAAAVAADQATMNSGLTAVNQAIDAVTTAQSALSAAAANYRQAQSNYSLKAAGNSAQTIAATSAKVDQALAELAKDTLRSPLDGQVTKVEPKPGEFVTAGQTVLGVISGATYKIEAFVPEADIVKVAVGNLASTTLDAYGADTNFEAIVTAIDPAETVLEGVPTYKVTLEFTKPDNRIRSGLTANLEILTHRRDNVLAVPTRAITDNNGQKTVRVVNPNGKAFSEVAVKTGLKGSSGTTEVVSGLTAGQTVVTYSK